MSRHLLSIGELGIDGIERILELTQRYVEVSSRRIPKVPALVGKTVVSLFFEDSTRTRLSFETAAKRLSADVMTFSTSTSSTNKGESLRDTIETIEAMGIDAIVVRHKSAGVPWQICNWTNASVVNGGDGWHQHPTQALLDCYTLRERLGSLVGKSVAIVGDIKHSRVARSNVEAFSALGAKVILVAPPTLLPSNFATWPVEVAGKIDDVIGHVDIIYLLRMQLERTNEMLVPSLREYTARFGLTDERTKRLSDSVLVLHPGPMNRGVEIGSLAPDRENTLITQQVANGVAVRMAVLFDLLATSSTKTSSKITNEVPSLGVEPLDLTENSRKTS